MPPARPIPTPAVFCGPAFLVTTGALDVLDALDALDVMGAPEAEDAAEGEAEEDPDPVGVAAALEVSVDEQTTVSGTVTPAASQMPFAYATDAA
jgi:hypothetical protein